MNSFYCDLLTAQLLLFSQLLQEDMRSVGQPISYNSEICIWVGRGGGGYCVIDIYKICNSANFYIDCL
jgi:hypothetical protein